MNKEYSYIILADDDEDDLETLAASLDRWLDS